MKKKKNKRNPEHSIAGNLFIARGQVLDHIRMGGSLTITETKGLLSFIKMHKLKEYAPFDKNFDRVTIPELITSLEEQRDTDGITFYTTAHYYEAA